VARLLHSGQPTGSSGAHRGVRFSGTLEYAFRIPEIHCARFLEFRYSLWVFGDFVTDLIIGVRSAAAEPLCFLQVLARN